MEMGDAAAMVMVNGVSDEDSTLMETFESQRMSQENLQKKLYFLLEHLKTFHSSLPEKYQMRIPYELLTELANSLLNDTVFEIVKGLMDIQHVTEKHLLQLREQVEVEHQKEIEDWTSKICDPEELQHIWKVMKLKHDQRMRETDKKIITHLDQKVRDQQSTLQVAGVPGFNVTDNPKDIKVQMYLLDFILRLSRLKFDGGR